ncbi:Kinase D-interacting substrate of 220 kDa [Durusdinium trenchii]|uniref:Kinase D-interacting substrate of 220 kDa n=1 Tax=Durusdinium trenchii TaxID=1381693 RepID=A0ABP0IR49_9DINO
MEADRVLTATERLAKRLGKPVAKPKQSPGLPVWTPVEKKQLELKLQSLHEVYAKKVAETELQYDKKLEEAEAEAQRWFKEKKAEITTLKAGVTIMQAFFEHRKRKFLQQLAEDRAENERLRVEMAERIAAAEAQMVETTEACERRVAELEAAQAKELKDLDALQRETEERAFRAERAVKLGDAEISRLQDVEKSLRFEIEDLRVRLQESERAEELHRAKEKAEFLEEELRKTRERMRTQRHLEAEELRRELMDYVKFIVKILPEEWQERLGPEIWRQVSKTELQVPMMIQAAEAMAEPPDTPAPPPPELEPATPASGHETDASEGSGET